MAVVEPEPVIVLVAARDVRCRDLLGALALAVGEHVVVIGTIGRQEAIHRVTSWYARATGCPDVVLIDEGLAEASFLDEELSRSCPGVRRIVAAPEVARLDELARVVDDCLVA